MAKPGRKPGTPKTGGRKKGTPNKYSGELRKDLSDLLVDNFPRLVTEMESLHGSYYVDAYRDLAKIVLPGLQSISLEATVANRVTIEDRLAELCQPKQD